MVAVSAVAHAGIVAAPIFSPAAGSYLSAQTVTLSTATSGASIAYTTDGSTPTESGGIVTHGSLYTLSLTISVTTTVNAISFEKGLTDSPVTSVTYTVNLSPSNAQSAPKPSSITLMANPAGTSRVLSFTYLKAKLISPPAPTESISLPVH
jgi:hypothetical protein